MVYQTVVVVKYLVVFPRYPYCTRKAEPRYFLKIKIKIVESRVFNLSAYSSFSNSPSSSIWLLG